MPDFVFLTKAPADTQTITAPTLAAAAREAGIRVARDLGNEGTSAFSVWMLQGPAQQFDVTVAVRFQRNLTVAPTPPPDPPT